ncbi:NADH dehydrogenase [ubiquinone] 1 alpha subcomplex subunit 9, mitochondrial isoform X2 [Solenopsis invicta]|uniref:NADH dehydrogenase [ubiquinone] 1 alpha subcomplex subunit 9, mitochondrial isoform X2 n=1 Tax=Solenopsis invicta TaxID=13686 RepID=UPI0005961DCE|nr:NADH dehydrogenase [ubiquinone] 1 alpha subcomplex subunit 9, mitochondrial isoform X2 [Solenopsis invicta]
MVALIPKYFLQAAGKQITCIAAFAVQTNRYLSQWQVIENPTIPLKKEIENCSSNRVVTVFGSNGCVEPYLVCQLAKINTQLILPHTIYLHFKDLPIKVQYPGINLYDDESIKKYIEYSDVVINLIHSDLETEEWDFDEFNVERPRRIARICKKANIKHFIHMSALNVGEHLKVLKNASWFLRTKWEGECAVRKEFPKATIIRPSDIWCPGDRLDLFDRVRYRYRSSASMWKKVKETEKQPVAVCDVAKGITAIVKDPENTAGKTYQFVGPKRYKLFEYVALTRRTRGLFDCTRFDFESTSYSEMSIRYAVKKIRFRKFINMENLKMQMISDKVSDKLPTLEDLGIALTPME